MHHVMSVRVVFKKSHSFAALTPSISDTTHSCVNTISFVLLDIDECLSGSHACDVTANCTNTYGSHDCTCKEGYTGDGQSCQGILD